MKRYQNIHAGRPGYILANGPSLAETDLGPLKSEITIGLNSSHLLLRSQYHWFAHTDPPDITDDDVAFLKHIPIGTQVFNIEGHWQGTHHKGVTYLPLLGGQGWSDDLTKGVFGAFTVAHPALQFAVWLGLNPITFIGLDLKEVRGRQHFTEKMMPEVPYFAGMNETLTQCVTLLEKRGILVYNASPYYEFGTIPKPGQPKANELEPMQLKKLWRHDGTPYYEFGAVSEQH